MKRLFFWSNNEVKENFPENNNKIEVEEGESENLNVMKQVYEYLL